MSKQSLSSYKKTKVDVLLPYWGDFSLLKKAVDSVLAQTEQDWRLFIIDDCYPSDEARKYYSNFPDKRVTFYRHKENFGLVKNYNFAINQATASYCVIMGSDDIMLPTYLETALSKINSADCYHPGVEVIDEKDKVYQPTVDRIKKFIRPKRSGIHTGESVATSLCHGNWTYFPAILWKTSTLKKYKFDQNRPNTQDLVTQFDILCDGGAFFIDNVITFQYRRSSFSFSSKAKKGTRFHEEDQMYYEFAERFRKLHWKKAARVAKLHLTTRVHQILS